jgi:NDP-mannose synthase
MRSAGLVMAGGDGRRMRDSGVGRPKPLVQVGGRTLLQHAIDWQVRAGLAEIFVAVRSDQVSTLSFLERLPPPREGVRISPLVEREAMGNAGALLSLLGRVHRVLFSFADNLCTLDASQLLEHHRAHGATATLAVHLTEVPFPFGVVEVSDGRITSYEEKPRVRRLIASGYGVFDLDGFRGVEVSGPMGLADAIQILLDRGKLVAALRHDRPWVDVNDSEQVAAAHALLSHESGEEPNGGASPRDPLAPGPGEGR